MKILKRREQPSFTPEIMTERAIPISLLPDEQRLRHATEDFERQYILQILDENKGRKGRTAEILGIDRKTLYLKLKKYELSL